MLTSSKYGKSAQEKVIATDETVKDIVHGEINKVLKKMSDWELLRFSHGNQSIDLNHIDVSRVTDMSGLFFGIGRELANFNGNLSQWDVSNVRKMDYMFCNSKFNGDITNWNVSNVETMEFMFSDSKYGNDFAAKWCDSQGRAKFESLTVHDFVQYNAFYNLSNWDVSNVRTMRGMFTRCPYPTDILRWKVRKDCDISFLVSEGKTHHVHF